MDTKWQALILTVLILFSLTLTRIPKAFENKTAQVEKTAAALIPPPSNLSFQKAALLNIEEEVKKSPARKWNTLDPKVKAASVLIQSLDESFPFFHYKTYAPWPLASLTKLLTAVVVLEDIGLDKKILVDKEAVAEEGESGRLKSGEVYTAQDLLKIMLLASSNDASRAFEKYTGGKDEFTRLINRKANLLGLHQTILHDGSGLADLNQSTASDLRRLTNYILEKHPEIFNWTRIPNLLVQPINDFESRTIYNINPFVEDKNFLGGKTGTSPETKENLLAIFSFNNYRILVILLGSPNRVEESKYLLDWIKEAYEF